MLAGFLLLTYITPVMLYVRGMREQLPWRERIDMTVDALKHWDEAQAAFLAFLAAEALSSGFFLEYYGMPNNIFERMSHVNHVDVLISGADRVGTLGTQVLEQAITRALPRFLAPDKPRGYSEGDWIYCKFGVKCLYGNYLTASLIGVGYAAFDGLGAIAFPFFLGLALLLLIRKMTGFSMFRNVWTVFLLITLNNQFVEGGAASYIAIIFRYIPQDFLIMLLLAVFVRGSRLKIARTGPMEIG
jgi:hypothetical protein